MSEKARHQKHVDALSRLVMHPAHCHRLVFELLESRALMAGDFFMPPSDWSFNGDDIFAANVYIGRAHARGWCAIDDFSGDEMRGEGLGPDDVESQIHQAIASQLDPSSIALLSKLAEYVESAGQNISLRKYDNIISSDPRDFKQISSQSASDNLLNDLKQLNRGSPSKINVQAPSSNSTPPSSNPNNSGTSSSIVPNNLGSSNSPHTVIASPNTLTSANNTKPLTTAANHKVNSLDSSLTHQDVSVSGAVNHATTTRGDTGELTASGYENNREANKNLDSLISTTSDNRSVTLRSLNGNSGNNESRASLIDSYFGYRTKLDAGREYAKLSDGNSRFSEFEADELNWDTVRERLANAQVADREISTAMQSARSASPAAEHGDWYAKAVTNVPAPTGMIVLPNSDDSTSQVDSATDKIAQSASSNPFGIVQIFLREDETIAPAMSGAEAATLARAKTDPKEEEAIPVSVRTVFAGATSALLFFRFNRSKKQREQLERERVG